MDRHAGGLLELVAVARRVGGLGARTVLLHRLPLEKVKLVDELAEVLPVGVSGLTSRPVKVSSSMSDAYSARARYGELSMRIYER